MRVVFCGLQNRIVICFEGVLKLNVKHQPVLPAWLTFALAMAFVISGMSVALFGSLTFNIIWNRPVNPVEAAAIDTSHVDLGLNQDGPPPAVPTLAVGQPTPTLIPTTEIDEDSDRINILLMGIDRRPDEPFISRTDSMMIVSVDKKDNTISILSVPRDLYVLIPGYGRDRINTAFVYGSTGNNPAGGAALAMQTIEYNLGVHIQHYAMVDFGAVIDGVDTLGGIDVYVPYDINDPNYPDMNYGYDPLYIPAGWQHFDGLTALKYARTRHGDNDFYRAERQQQVVLAVRSKVLGLGLTGMLAQAPVFYNQLQEGIRTDLSLDEIASLVSVASDIPEENIQSDVLDYDYVTNYTTDAGAAVLILINDKAATLIQELFYK